MRIVHGFRGDNTRGDIYGGLTAAVVALPLALALGVASGAGPIAGLYGAIAAGFFAAPINIPGNSVLGGGGGIALATGFRRRYRWPLFILTVAVASLPIPLLVFLGFVEVDRWLAALD